MKKGTVVNITEYDLQLDRDRKPVCNTYKHKKTGEIVKINYSNGKFRVI